MDTEGAQIIFGIKKPFFFLLIIYLIFIIINIWFVSKISEEDVIKSAYEYAKHLMIGMLYYDEVMLNKEAGSSTGNQSN